MPWLIYPPTVTTEFTPDRSHPGRWILLDLTQNSVFHRNPVLTVREILGLGLGAPCTLRRLLLLLVQRSGARQCEDDADKRSRDSEVFVLR